MLGRISHGPLKGTLKRISLDGQSILGERYFRCLRGNRFIPRRITPGPVRPCDVTDTKVLSRISVVVVQ